MNREFLHKITILGCLFLLITSSSGMSNGFQTPEQYAQIVQEHFANEEWEAGKELLEEAFRNTRMFLTLNGSWENTGSTKRTMTSRVIILSKR